MHLQSGSDQGDLVDSQPLYSTGVLKQCTSELPQQHVLLANLLACCLFSLWSHCVTFGACMSSSEPIPLCCTDLSAAQQSLTYLGAQC